MPVLAPPPPKPRAAAASAPQRPQEQPDSRCPATVSASAVSSTPTATEPVEVVRHEYRFSTAQTWYDAIGRVPLDRVIFDPLPGTATEEDVVSLDVHQDVLCELVFGTLVRKTLGLIESVIAVNVGTVVNNFVRPRRLGVVAGEGGMMRLLRRQIRLPDVSFISHDSLPDGKLPPGAAPEVVPALAVEVISPSNTPQEMGIKLREYFEAGTRLVWYVYPITRTVDVYTAVDQMTTLQENDTLTGGDVLPGFEVKVADLFDTGFAE